MTDSSRELGKHEFIIWVDPHAENFYLKMGCKKIGVKKSSMMPNRYPSILQFKIPDLSIPSVVLAYE